MSTNGRTPTGQNLILIRRRAYASTFHASANVRRLPRNLATCLAVGTLDSELSHTLTAPPPCYSDVPTEDDNLIAPQMTNIPMARAINQISKLIAP